MNKAVGPFAFQEHEVEKMFTLKGGRLPPADVKNIIFFVRPRLELMDIIAENVFRFVEACVCPVFHAKKKKSSRKRDCFGHFLPSSSNSSLYKHFPHFKGDMLYHRAL